MKPWQRASNRRAWCIWLGDPRPPAQTPAFPLSPTALAEIIAQCAQHGVLPAAVRNLNHLMSDNGRGPSLFINGHQSSSKSFQKILAGAVEQVVPLVGRAELLRAVQRELVAALRARGIEPIILKGTTFADHLYPDPSLRPFGDIDVLVPEQALPEARQAMIAMGLIPVKPIDKKHTEPYAEEGWTHPALKGVLIELHWDLVGSPKVRKAVSLTYEDLLPLIGPEGRPNALALLLVAAIHGAAGHGFEILQHVFDVAQAARGAAGSIDGEKVRLVAKPGQRLALEAAVLTAALILSDEDCARFARNIGSQASARLLSRLLGAATIVEARGRRHFRYSWRRQLYREALVRLALSS
jgi:hypothetical protein